MDMRLGRFGDRRLEKGGPIFLAAWLKVVVARCGFAGWVVAERGRCA
jgi:hypothetical protein